MRFSVIAYTKPVHVTFEKSESKDSLGLPPMVMVRANKHCFGGEISASFNTFFRVCESTTGLMYI